MFSFSRRSPPIAEIAIQAKLRDFIRQPVVKNILFKHLMKDSALTFPSTKIQKIFDHLYAIDINDADGTHTKALLEGELFILTEWTYSLAKQKGLNSNQLSKITARDKLKLENYEGIAEWFNRIEPAEKFTAISACIGMLRQSLSPSLKEHPSYKFSDNLKKTLDKLADPAVVVTTILKKSYLNKGFGVFQLHSHNETAQEIIDAINALYKTAGLEHRTPTAEEVKGVLEDKLNDFFQKNGSTINYKGNFMKALVNAQIYLDERLKLEKNLPQKLQP